MFLDFIKRLFVTMPSLGWNLRRGTVTVTVFLLTVVALQGLRGRRVDMGVIRDLPVENMEDPPRVNLNTENTRPPLGGKTRRRMII
jgi:hypothetical protein